jgi:hypothetical protein
MEDPSGEYLVMCNLKPDGEAGLAPFIDRSGPNLKKI